MCTGASRRTGREGIALTTDAKANARPTYFLEDLIAQCDLSADKPLDHLAWHDLKPVGKEKFDFAEI